jgi:beta-glucosidase
MHYVRFRPAAPAALNLAASHLAHNLFNEMFVMAVRDGIARIPGMRAVPVPQVKGAYDWIGLQYYEERRVSFNPFSPSTIFMTLRKPKDMLVGPGTWGGINPAAILEPIRWLWKTQQKPIYITESGVPDPDDTIRPGYMLQTLRAVWRAVNFNLPVRGYFVWSLLDNFEWAEGYDPRFSFGLYKTDIETQQRTARQSARLYREICAMNGLSASMVTRYAPELVAEMFPGEAGQSEVKLKPRSSKL